MENVNHPKHYKKEGRKECIVEMQELFGRKITAIFCLTNAFKYLYRAGEKLGNSKEQDKAKAKWYYTYVTDHLGSSVIGQGQLVLKLFRYVKERI